MELPTDRQDYSQWKEDPETGELVQVHDVRGWEIPDPVPMAPPLGFTKPLSMFDQMRAQIRAEHTRLRALELEELAETAEQANDFDVDEDIENQPSLYEEKFDPVSFEVRNRLRNAEHRAKVTAAVDTLPPEQKELLNGDSLGSYDQGRREVVDDDNRGSDRDPEPVSGKKQKTGVRSGVSKGSGVAEADAE